MVKTKEQIAEEHGYERMEGYCFNACRAEDDMLTFVEKDEANAVMAMGPKEYWWDGNHEQLFDLETVLEYIYDDAEGEYADYNDWLTKVLNE